MIVILVVLVVLVVIFENNRGQRGCNNDGGRRGDQQGRNEQLIKG